MQMRYTHAYRNAPDGAPRLGRAEALLYVLLLYVFNYVHPRYQDYADALHAWHGFQRIERRMVYCAAWRAHFAKPAPADWARAPIIRADSLPDGLVRGLLACGRCVFTSGVNVIMRLALFTPAPRQAP